jgi:hypothetical protein
MTIHSVEYSITRFARQRGTPRRRADDINCFIPTDDGRVNGCKHVLRPFNMGKGCESEIMKMNRWKVNCFIPVSSLIYCLIMFSTLLLRTLCVHKHRKLTLELVRAGVLLWIVQWRCHCTCCQSSSVLFWESVKEHFSWHDINRT